MTKLLLILSIAPLFTADILTSLFIVKKYQPVKDYWKIPIWIVVAISILILSGITSKHESGLIWKGILLCPTIALLYLPAKNMLLGLIWHKNAWYMGKKGFDKWILVYFNNPQLLILSCLIAALVFSGLWHYV